jgi:signal transduction histidine kinase
VKLVPRIMLLGVVLPLAGLVGSVGIASTLFRRSLVQDVDRRLLAQAAVESVSLFDGPDGRPHVHMPKSELAAEVAAFAPATTLIAPDGHVVVTVPEGRAFGPVPRETSAGRPRIEALDGRARTLTLGVRRPGEGIYTLRMVASLDPVAATMRSFYRSLGGTVVGIAGLLALVLYLQARGLARRVDDLIGFVPRIRRSESLPEREVAGDDELTALDAALTDAARFLYEQRQAQERFLANAAHQLRTPLAVLRTEIDLALRRPRDPGELRAALEMARRETDRLTSLARKLLDFESLRSLPLDLQDVDLRSVAREVVERQSAAAAQHGVTLVDAGSPSAPARCDPLLLAQALENLVDNSLRFAPAGSRVEVSVHGVGGGGARLLVSDEGVGIPEAERERVFEPFYRGTAPGSQTGLGLAFVADVARKHGGRAVVLPSERGTTISIELPA